MKYEMTSHLNNYQVEEFVDESDELEAASLGEFLRTLILGLGAVVVISVAVYLAVVFVLGLGLSVLN